MCTCINFFLKITLDFELVYESQEASKEKSIESSYIHFTQLPPQNI